jgi:hypothetical protein
MKRSAAGTLRSHAVNLRRVEPRMPRFSALTAEDCYDVLARSHVGRLAFITEGFIDIEPAHCAAANSWRRRSRIRIRRHFGRRFMDSTSTGSPGAWPSSAREAVSTPFRCRGPRRHRDGAEPGMERECARREQTRRG